MVEREIITASGKAFDFWNAEESSICIEDIAHALSITNRYGGHTKVPYSVAEHCVRASRLDAGVPLWNLLHDAAEAYIADIASPQKATLWVHVEQRIEFIQMQKFSELEQSILWKIGNVLGITNLNGKCRVSGVKQADKVMMATEVRDLMPPGTIEHPAFKVCLEGIEPDKYKIVPWNWRTAEREFLHRFEELMDAYTKNESSNN